MFILVTLLRPFAYRRILINTTYFLELVHQPKQNQHGSDRISIITSQAKPNEIIENNFKIQNIQNSQVPR